jgi:hypothetical protein
MINLTPTSNKEKKKKSDSVDRFIPTRSNDNDVDVNNYKMYRKINFDEKETSKYNNELEKRLFSESIDDIEMLNVKRIEEKEEQNLNLRNLYSNNKYGENLKKKSFERFIKSTPDRILDAPGFIDDFYLNLIDWSSNNILAVALSESVYLWNGLTSEIKKLMELNIEEDQTNFITSLSWTDEGKHIAIATNSAETQIWDVVAGKKIKTMLGHEARVKTFLINLGIFSFMER